MPNLTFLTLTKEETFLWKTMKCILPLCFRDEKTNREAKTQRWLKIPRHLFTSLVSLTYYGHLGHIFKLWKEYINTAMDTQEECRTSPAIKTPAPKHFYASETRRNKNLGQLWRMKEVLFLLMQLTHKKSGTKQGKLLLTTGSKPGAKQFWGITVGTAYDCLGLFLALAGRIDFLTL